MKFWSIRKKKVMRQRKRREKTDGLGYYTYWEKKRENGCLYCGAKAETREHVPSKTLLEEPYPENLPTIPACFKCNNGFSLDEQYFACFLEFLKSSIYIGYQCNDKIVRTMNENLPLKQLIESQIKNIDGKINFTYDISRFDRIVSKLAIGHVGYEFDNVCFDGPKTIWYEFSFRLKEDFKRQFLKPQIMNKFPEISSRFACDYCIIQNTETGEAFLLNDWIDIQEQRYEYHTFINDKGGITVRMLIFDILFCQVDFE